MKEEPIQPAQTWQPFPFHPAFQIPFLLRLFVASSSPPTDPNPAAFAIRTSGTLTRTHNPICKTLPQGWGVRQSYPLWPTIDAFDS